MYSSLIDQLAQRFSIFTVRPVFEKLSAVPLFAVTFIILILFPSHGYANPVQNIYVEIGTSNDYFSGTDDDVYIVSWHAKNDTFRGQITPPSSYYSSVVRILILTITNAVIGGVIMSPFPLALRNARYPGLI